VLGQAGSRTPEQLVAAWPELTILVALIDATGYTLCGSA
jgi:hypothetical protein